MNLFKAIFSPFSKPPDFSDLHQCLKVDHPYKIWVGMPLDKPRQWAQASLSNDRRHVIVDGIAIEIERLSSFLLAYENGEVVTEHASFRCKYPEGTAHLRMQGISPVLPTLAAMEEGNAILNVQHGSHYRSEGGCYYYPTRVKNIGDSAVRITSFFGVIDHEMNTRTIAKAYDGDQFKNWFNVNHDDGWLMPGVEVSDLRNFSGADMWWVYLFHDVDGREYMAGALF